LRRAKGKEPAERADLIERGFAEIASPQALVKPWFEARLEVPGNREATGARSLEITVDSADPDFLDAMGNELARRSFDGEAIEVFTRALAAGSKTMMTKMLLGYLLARRGDPACVPLLEEALASSPGWDLPMTTLAAWYVERDPARTLELLVDPRDYEHHDLRAMAYEAMGRTADAERATSAAIASLPRAIDAHRKLAEWHARNYRHARALTHGRALFALRTAADEDIDEAILRAYRDGGAFHELVPWLREYETFSLGVGWYVYFGLRGQTTNPDPALTMRAAREVSQAYAKQGDVREARKWTIREAYVSALAGDTTHLDELVNSGLDDDPDAWVEVAHTYIAMNEYDAANAAADRALVLDAQQPLMHQGPEFLARSFARRLDATAALMHSERALAMAAYCHNAWIARAEAFAIAGDLERARAHAERSLAIHPPDADGDDAVIVLAAVTKNRVQLDAEAAKRHKHAPGAFSEYFGYLRQLADA